MSEDEDRNVTRGQAFLQELSDVESVPGFLGDAKVHAWLGGSEDLECTSHMESSHM